MSEFDLVIRAGTVVDGTGRAPGHADVAVTGGIMIEVGGVAVRRREMDVDGAIVAPGFVDIHTHYDGQATWDERLQPSSWNGVTTVVMGNCGVGFAPVVPENHDRLIELMEGMEDIPGSRYTRGSPGSGPRSRSIWTRWRGVERHRRGRSGTPRDAASVRDGRRASALEEATERKSIDGPAGPRGDQGRRDGVLHLASARPQEHRGRADPILRRPHRRAGGHRQSRRADPKRGVAGRHRFHPGVEGVRDDARLVSQSGRALPFCWPRRARCRAASGGARRHTEANRTGCRSGPGRRRRDRTDAGAGEHAAPVHAQPSLAPASSCSPVAEPAGRMADRALKAEMLAVRTQDRSANGTTGSGIKRYEQMYEFTDPRTTSRPSTHDRGPRGRAAATPWSWPTTHLARRDAE